MQPRIIISSCHSGPNPSSGLGIARSLRTAFPEAFLVAKDHSTACSGIHDPVFDDVLLFRPWNDLDLSQHRADLLSEIEAGALLISGQDLEIQWLSEQNLRANFLGPSSTALMRTAKPTIEAAQGLGLSVPSYIHLHATDQSLQAFGNRYGYPVWVKGGSYEAKSSKNWQEIVQARFEIETRWGSGGFLQEPITGWEMSIAYAAYQGELLGAVFMEKLAMTNEGKAWSATIHSLSEEDETALRKTVADLQWTGGGEIECIRDNHNRRWVIDWNPRFPAWIHGATLCGANLPALLVARALKEKPPTIHLHSSQFTRVITEIPVKKTFPLPPLPSIKSQESLPLGKHPAGIHLLQQKRAVHRPLQPVTHQQIPPTLRQDLLSNRSPAKTPQRFLLANETERVFSLYTSRAHAQSDTTLTIRLAYSIKTNPDPLLLKKARLNGFLAEAISATECDLALAVGFTPDRVICNGPLPWQRDGVTPYIVFADSIEALACHASTPHSRIIGIRLRPPSITSRFGIEVDSPAEFQKLVALLKTLPAEKKIACSFHVQISQIGLSRWKNACYEAMMFAQALVRASGHHIHTFDVGGGWQSNDSHLFMDSVVPWLKESLRALLPQTTQLILEPGKSLLEPCYALATRVKEIRARGNGTREAILDASIAEIPLAQHFPHTIHLMSGADIQPLERGKDRLLGRLCMEHDILAQDISLPAHMHVEDVLFFCDIGAYDTSMSYRFGNGEISHL